MSSRRSDWTPSDASPVHAAVGQEEPPSRAAVRLSAELSKRCSVQGVEQFGFPEPLDAAAGWRRHRHSRQMSRRSTCTTCDEKLCRAATSSSCCTSSFCTSTTKLRLPLYVARIRIIPGGWGREDARGCENLSTGHTCGWMSICISPWYQRVVLHGPCGNRHGLRAISFVRMYLSQWCIVEGGWE